MLPNFYCHLTRSDVKNKFQKLSYNLLDFLETEQFCNRYNIKVLNQIKKIFSALLRTHLSVATICAQFSLGEKKFKEWETNFYPLMEFCDINHKTQSFIMF